MTAAATPGLVQDVLDEYGELTRKGFGRYLPQGEPRRYLYDLVGDYPHRRGKMLRSSLCLAAARAFGGSTEDALATAISIELLHNALLIHDDVEDESETRRGKPALHVMHGVPMAVNTGDALTLLSLRPLFENRHRLGPHLASLILEETERTARESAEGQAMELGWRRDNSFELTEADYLRMVLKKTCWLMAIHPLRVGALIGSLDTAPRDRLIRFGFFLGAAFQIHDDVLNLASDEPRYGKELNGDLWEGKRTLMLIRLFREVDEQQRSRLREILALPREGRHLADMKWIRGLMERHDCIAYARHLTHGLAGAALHEFSLAFSHLPDSRDKQFIRQLVAWVFERSL